MVTTITADSILKSYYLDVVADQLNKSANPFLAAIKKTTSDVWGKDVRKAVCFGVNGGVGAGTETGALPKASGNNYAQFVTPLKNLFGTVEISDKALRAAAGNEGAFVNLLNEELAGLVKSASFHFGRMLFGDGSGKLATFTSVSDGDVVDSVLNLAEGMLIDLYSSANSKKASGIVIRKVDRAKKKVVLSGGTVAVGDYLVLQNSLDLELTGLKAIFADTGYLYDVDREDNPWLLTHKVEKVGSLTENVIQTAMDTVAENSGGTINFILCSWGVRRALIGALSSYRTLEPLKLEGGHTAISFNGIPVVADRFCPEGTMYLLNTDDFAIHQLCDWQWLENEDGRILKQLAGKPVYSATLVKYAELMCYRPCGQAMLSGITEA